MEDERNTADGPGKSILAGSNTIVLIDPASEASDALAGRLEMQGYDVVLCRDSAEGAHRALAEKPCAVIADLWMPGISGVQLCRLLKAEPATEHVPVVLRGPSSSRNLFWAERAGASAYVIKGRMGDLVRALRRSISDAPLASGSSATLAGQDIRDRIAALLDAALFESVLAAELRALGTCGEFARLFDLLSQFVSRVTHYRWLAVSTEEPARLAVHASPRCSAEAEQEARAALNVADGALLIKVEDDDARVAPLGPPVVIKPIELGGIRIGHLAISLSESEAQGENLATIIAREIAAPIRMASLVEESQRLATIDPLTGLMNRRAFVAGVQRVIAACKRYGHDLSLCLLDVDHFKLVNDRFGHGAGDAVLAAVGRLLHAEVRASDIAARWGGEEFVVALTSTEIGGARVAAERLRRSLQDLVVLDSSGARVPITGSIGIAGYEASETLEALVERADRAMYAAKKAGRNRVVADGDRTSSVVSLASGADRP
ncbi:MAG TPA: diguanylate cyclase [Polyangiaceae bacterium]|jgi:two-component system cell cycle response regulator|nr:diguanylate cyclase [Polyangiaceae bacterium]